MKKITVLVCDDHQVVREGLRSLLESAADIQVVGEAENGYGALDMTKRTQPNVALMDLALPLMNGVEATRRIHREVPATKVLILSSYSDAQHVRQAVAAGAAGYLMKQGASADLLQAIREVCEGNTAFSPPLAHRMVKPGRNGDAQPALAAGPVLTSRQTEVLQLIAEGYTNERMAAVLALSKKTVEKHRQALMNKLGIHNIAALTRYAVSSGVVESRPSVLVETPPRDGAPAEACIPLRHL